MNIKKLIAILFLVLLLSSCARVQDMSGPDEPKSVRVSGDLTLSASSRSGF